MYLSRICVSNASYYSHCHMFTGGTNKTPLDHLHLVWCCVPVVLLEKKIYYFGGYCNHGECRNNSLHELDIDDFKWTVCLANSDNGPMKKSNCGVAAIHQTLLVIGGYGSPPKNRQPSAQYDQLYGELVCSNEHHLHRLGTGELRSVMTCAVCACRMFVGGSLLKDGGSLRW